MTKWKRYVKCSLYSLAICENQSCGLLSYCCLLSLIFFSVYLEKLVFRNLEFLEMFTSATIGREMFFLPVELGKRQEIKFSHTE